ncbi:hypothetical protein [Oxynema aestuarii]|uniref:Uncharacterized protein n=1 Tax=Oxynema aestuarii AP17 TaxID=2064643 RepID=A0A6H1TT40_9CYAN|nr:hypothetical protein [Oxynema aestuarii]QIZ69711.1 hypothetical protein HCG48_03220 [Oxynema aestuarii AP17]
MKLVYELLKKGLCVGIPLGLSLGVSLAVANPSVAQNQSDSTGPIPGLPPGLQRDELPPGLQRDELPPGLIRIIESGRFITNQSDVTGPIVGPGTNQSDITGGGGIIIVRRLVIRLTTAGFIDPLNAGLQVLESSTTTTTTTTTTVTETITPEQPPAVETVETEPVETPVEVAETPETVETPETREPVATNQSDITGVSLPTAQTTTVPIDVQPLFSPMVLMVPSNRNNISTNNPAFTNLLLDSFLSQLSFSRLQVVSMGNSARVIMSFNGRRVIIALAGVAMGSTQDFPVMPASSRPGSFRFVGVVSGVWVDPPTSEGFHYEMESDSLFTEIMDFPTGFDGKFTVSSGGRVLGEFGPGESVDFSDFPGGGVKEFTITGIDPLADPADPMAFPLQVAFNTEKADFSMAAIEKIESLPEAETATTDPGPFEIAVVTPDETVNLEPGAIATSLEAQADMLTGSEANWSPVQLEAFENAVAAVRSDLDMMSGNFEGLFTRETGINTSRLNPTMASVESLQQSLSALVEQVNAIPGKTDPDRAAAVGQMLQDIESMTLLLEAMNPMLDDLSEAIATAR